MTPRPIVAGLGQVAVVFAGRAPRAPQSDAAVDLSEITLQPGGTAAVAMGTAAAMGCHARLAARVAQDPLGAFVLGALEQVGIDTELVDIAPSQLTCLEFAAITDEGRTAFRSRGDIVPLEAGSVDADHLLRDAGALVIDGHAPRAQAQVAAAARDRAIPVVFDGTALDDDTSALIALADIVISSERLAAELAPGDPETSLRALAAMGPSAVVITMGEAGCVGLHAGRVIEQAAVELDVADAADAGDVFLGAFVAALVARLPFSHCMRFATAAAALSCQALGAWAGIPDRAAVLALLRGAR